MENLERKLISIALEEGNGEKISLVLMKNGNAGARVRKATPIAHSSRSVGDDGADVV